MHIGDRDVFEWYGMHGDKMPAPDDIVLYPDLSFSPVMFHYAAETCKPHDIAKTHGFELAVDTMESQLADDDPLYVAYFENGCGDVMNKWKPEAKDGWKLVGKNDHADGPIAFYIRKLDETQS